MKLNRIWLLCLLLWAHNTLAQTISTDSLAEWNDAVRVEEVQSPEIDTLPVSTPSPYRFRPTQLIAPALLIGVGVAGVESNWLKDRCRDLRGELQYRNPHHIKLDNYLQYAPMVSVYGLQLCGVRGKHDVVDCTIILATAYAVMGVSVNALKYSCKVQRPDGSAFNSFPSGHTATAFMGAEFLRREYRDVSPWIGVAGYSVALATGFLRMYNNRHWLTDVLAGAGIGILSVEAAYWLYPTISKTFFRKRYLRNVWLAPSLTSESKGLVCSLRF